MRWQALQEGKVYVKQNITDDQITITDIQERISQGDNYIADRIMRFEEGLRGSQQFWNARRWELSDMIKQIGSQGLVFFTFSAADLHWPELHNSCHLVVILQKRLDQSGTITKILSIILILWIGSSRNDSRFS